MVMATTNDIHSHWASEKEKAAMNLAKLTHKHMPQSEDDIKSLLAYAMKYGSYEEAAEAVVEAAEWEVAYHMCKATENAQ